MNELLNMEREFLVTSEREREESLVTSEGVCVCERERASERAREKEQLESERNTHTKAIKHPNLDRVAIFSSISIQSVQLQ